MNIRLSDGRWLAVILIPLAVAILYSNVYQVPFVFDGVMQIEDKARIRDLKNYSSPRVLLSRRPLVELTYALNYRYGKLDVFGYHLVNVLIHMTNGLLAYFLALTIFRRLCNNPRFSNARMPQFPNYSIPLMSLFTALVFVSHPIQTQAVTYIAQRYTCMAAMFYLASVLFYLKARTTPGSGKITLKTVSLFVCSFFSGIAAFLCKENAASLPGAIILVEYLCIDRTWQGWKRKLFWLVPAFFLMILFILYVSGLFRGGVNFGRLLEDVSWLMKETSRVGRWSYLCTQFNVLVLYIRLLFLPIGQNVDYMYPFNEGFWGGYTPFALVFLVAIVGLGAWSIKRRPALGFGIFWFFITLSVESSVIPIRDAVFEHRLYLPMFGFALVVPYLLFSILRDRPLWVVNACILIILSLGTATYLRNRVWQDRSSLWSDVASKSPHNFRAHYNLGNALRDRGRLDEAIKSYSEALRIKPNYAIAHDNLGIALTESGKLDDAVRHFSEALRFRPGDAWVHNNYGQALTQKGKLDDAVRHFKKALRFKPGLAEAHNNLGIALARQGDMKGAIRHFSKSLKSRPDDAMIHCNLGLALMHDGRREEAIRRFSRALEIDPGFDMARRGLRESLKMERKWGPRGAETSLDK